MDNSGTTAGSSNSRFWTNERHVHFLNSIESTFVHSMFENNASSPKLDRQLPDSFESTQDLGRERRRRHSTSDVGEYSSSVVMRRDKKNKRLPPPNSHHDQVVPQLENRIDGVIKDDEKERDRHHPC